MLHQDTATVKTFLLLLRSGMYGVPIPESQLPESIDWDTIVRLAREHVVFGIIIDGVQLLPERLRPPVMLSVKMNKFALGLIQANLVMDQTVARLVTFFKRYGISGVLLKGQGVARYYRVPQMRQSGDIDFYVGRLKYDKTVGLCREHLLGDKGKCAYGETEQHFCFSLGGVEVELHRLASRIYSPHRNRLFQRWVTDELEYSRSRRTLTVGNTDITLPSYDFDAIFIFYHAWRHYIEGGIGLRQLCDWAMIFYSHADDIDTPRLIENVTRFGMTKGWKLFASIAVHHLGVQEDKMPLYDPSYRKRSERLLSEIIEGGNFGYYSGAVMAIPKLKYDIWSELGKLRYITVSFFSLFPLIPVEATSLFVSRLCDGVTAVSRRLKRRLKR